MRIEHPQEFINQLRYGMRKAPPALGSAEYSFASKPNANGSIAGATTFCMCPGGELIPATSDSGQLCTNGMSNSDRDGFFANAAIVTAQDLSQFRTPAEAFAFLDMLEKKTFEAGGGDYTCPAQTAEDFMRGTAGELPDDGSYGLGLRKFRVDSLLPEASKRAIRRAIKHIDNVVPGYIDNGVVVGLETRVSSPVRFDRDPETRETSVANFYAIGEGAGMAAASCPPPWTVSASRKPCSENKAEQPAENQESRCESVVLAAFLLQRPFHAEHEIAFFRMKDVCAGVWKFRRRLFYF